MRTVRNTPYAYPIFYRAIEDALREPGSSPPPLVAVAFDVIGTLTSIELLRGRLTDVGQPPYLLEAGTPGRRGRASRCRPPRTS